MEKMNNSETWARMSLFSSFVTLTLNELFKLRDFEVSIGEPKLITDDGVH